MQQFTPSNQPNNNQVSPRSNTAYYFSILVSFLIDHISNIGINNKFELNLRFTTHDSFDKC